MTTTVFVSKKKLVVKSKKTLSLFSSLPFCPKGVAISQLYIGKHVFRTPIEAYKAAPLPPLRTAVSKRTQYHQLLFFVSKLPPKKNMKLFAVFLAFLLGGEFFMPRFIVQ